MNRLPTRCSPSRFARACAHLLFLLAFALSFAACKSSSQTKTTRIAVVPKGMTHEFWKAVHAGADQAGKEEQLEIAWRGPMTEDDLKGQIDVVRGFIAQGVSGIVLAPLSDKGLEAPVKEAADRKIPTVVFDSDLQGSAHVSFVATDNYAAGKMAAEQMAKLLGGKGSVVVLRYQEGSASTMNREKGFLDGIAAHPGITVKSQDQYGGATADSAEKKAEGLLTAVDAKTQVQGIFTPNESTTFGMLRALSQLGLAKQIHFIGFDASDKLVAALKDGTIDALVLQDPFNIGYLAVKTISRHIKGQKVEGRIDTGSKLLTKDNLDTPEMKALLSPHE